MSRHYSQREARRMAVALRMHEVREQSRNRVWCSEWPAGVHIATVAPNTDQLACVKTARRLGHAVVVTISDGQLMMHALQLKTS